MEVTSTVGLTVSTERLGHFSLITWSSAHSEPMFRFLENGNLHLEEEINKTAQKLSIY